MAAGDVSMSDKQFRYAPFADVTLPIGRYGSLHSLDPLGTATSMGWEAPTLSETVERAVATEAADGVAANNDKLLGFLQHGLQGPSSSDGSCSDSDDDLDGTARSKEHPHSTEPMPRPRPSSTSRWPSLLPYERARLMNTVLRRIRKHPILYGHGRDVITLRDTRELLLTTGTCPEAFDGLEVAGSAYVGRQCLYDKMIAQLQAAVPDVRCAIRFGVGAGDPLPSVRLHPMVPASLFSATHHSSLRHERMANGVTARRLWQRVIWAWRCGLLRRVAEIRSTLLNISASVSMSFAGASLSMNEKGMPLIIPPSNQSSSTGSRRYLPTEVYHRICQDTRIGLGIFAAHRPAVYVLWSSWDSESVRYVEEQLFNPATFDAWSEQEAAAAAAASNTQQTSPTRKRTSASRASTPSLAPAPPSQPIDGRRGRTSVSSASTGRGNRFSIATPRKDSNEKEPLPNRPCQEHIEDPHLAFVKKHVPEKDLRPAVSPQSQAPTAAPTPQVNLSEPSKVLRSAEIVFPKLSLSSGGAVNFPRRGQGRVATIVLVSLDNDKAEAQRVIDSWFRSCPMSSRNVEVACMWAGPEGLQSELATLFDVIALPCVLAVVPPDTSDRDVSIEAPPATSALSATHAQARAVKTHLVPWRERCPIITVVTCPNIASTITVVSAAEHLCPAFAAKANWRKELRAIPMLDHHLKLLSDTIPTMDASMAFTLKCSSSYTTGTVLRLRNEKESAQVGGHEMGIRLVGAGFDTTIAPILPALLWARDNHAKIGFSTEGFNVLVASGPMTPFNMSAQSSPPSPARSPLKQQRGNDLVRCSTCSRACEGDHLLQCLHCDEAGLGVCERCVVSHKHDQSHVLLMVKAERAHSIDGPSHPPLLWGRSNVKALPTMRGVLIPSSHQCHVGVFCHRCHQHIYHVRWKCAECFDCDLCDDCHRGLLLAHMNEGDGGMAVAEPAHLRGGIVPYKPWHHTADHALLRIACPTPGDSNKFLLTDATLLSMTEVLRMV